MGGPKSQIVTALLSILTYPSYEVFRVVYYNLKESNET